MPVTITEKDLELLQDAKKDQDKVNHVLKVTSGFYLGVKSRTGKPDQHLFSCVHNTKPDRLYVPPDKADRFLMTPKNYLEEAAEYKEEGMDRTKVQFNMAFEIHHKDVFAKLTNLPLNRPIHIFYFERYSMYVIDEKVLVQEAYIQNLCGDCDKEFIQIYRSLFCLPSEVGNQAPPPPPKP